MAFPRLIVVLLVSTLVGSFALLCLTTPVDAANEPDIQAQHAIVVDVTSGEVLYTKAADAPAPIASLTKLITASVALESLPLDTRMTVTEADIIGEASMALQPGETLTLNALLHGMLMVSGNDAALVVARETGAVAEDSAWQAVQRFMDRVNLRIDELGLSQTRLSNPHGLDHAEQYSSARDMAIVGLYIARFQPELLTILGKRTWVGEGHSLTNTNAMLDTYPGLIAGKTGYTREAGYCLLEIASRGDRTLLTVLLDGDEETWYRDAATLLDFGFSLAPGSTAAKLGTLTPGTQATPAHSVEAQVTAQSRIISTAPDTHVVMVDGVMRNAPWRWFVVAFVSGAMALALLAAALAAPRRLPQPAGSRDSSPVRMHPDTATVWETQPYLPINAHGFQESYGATTQQSGWTTPFLPFRGSAHRGAAIRPIRYGIDPSWRLSNGD